MMEILGVSVVALAATAAGAVVGGAAGGINCAMIESGVPEKDALIYAEGIRRGGAVVAAKVDSDKVATAQSILDRSSRVDQCPP